MLPRARTRPGPSPGPVAWLLVDRIGRAMQIAVLVAAIGPARFRFAIDGMAWVQANRQTDQDGVTP
jgi:hypothetical protein